jgi:serine/threonine protein kinase
MPDHSDDATLSAGAPAADQTLPASEPSAGSSPPVVIRAGAGDDYSQLIGIDPKHYVVGAELARGGMGRILQARDRRLGRPVAIKELLHESSDSRARFEREARITGASSTRRSSASSRPAPGPAARRST